MNCPCLKCTHNNEMYTKCLGGRTVALSHLLSAWGDYVERQIMLFSKYVVFKIEGDFTVHAVWNL